MFFQHSKEVWRDFPELAAGVAYVVGIHSGVRPSDVMTKYYSVAEGRLDAGSEAELPEVQAWRRAFSRMGLKPTQYRCASESLLRRYRKEGNLPSIHPLIDLCNSVSLAYAIPIAVFDVAEVAGGLEVRYATGAETYLTFAGEIENPEPGEVIFADEEGRAHARRWTNRQSRYSAISEGTTRALLVAEALHPSAAHDIERLLGDLGGDLKATWGSAPVKVTLTEGSPRFDF